MAVLGLNRRSCYVEVSSADLIAQMGWGVRAIVDRRSVRAVTEDDGRVWGWGAHGWRGVWLINGSSSGIIRIELDPPGQARVLGLRVRLRILRVALEDPDRFRLVVQPA